MNSIATTKRNTLWSNFIRIHVHVVQDCIRNVVYLSLMHRREAPSIFYSLVMEILTQLVTWKHYGLCGDIVLILSLRVRKVIVLRVLTKFSIQFYFSRTVFSFQYFIPHYHNLWFFNNRCYNGVIRKWCVQSEHACMQSEHSIIISHKHARNHSYQYV